MLIKNVVFSASLVDLFLLSDQVVHGELKKPFTNSKCSSTKKKVKINNTPLFIIHEA